MKLKIGKPMAVPYQRRDTGKWLANGSIAVHNDRERVSVDVLVRAGSLIVKRSGAKSSRESKPRFSYALAPQRRGSTALSHG